MIKSRDLKLSFVSVTIVLAGVALSKGWEEYSDPSKLNGDYIYNYGKLTELTGHKGEIKGSHTPWTDSYWPDRKMGIAHRWYKPICKKNTKEDEYTDCDFKYKTPEYYQIIRMSTEQLKKLSPAEKFDIFRGRYDFPLVKKMKEDLGPHMPKWKGICDGWTPAALNHPEPKAVEHLKNDDGITVPFGASDIKALMSYYYSQIQDDEFEVKFLGLRCGGGFLGIKGKKCKDDVNAGAFHVIMENQLGILGKGFAIDVTIGRQKEVWNQPVIGFESRRISVRVPDKKDREQKKIHERTYREYLMQTTLKYVAEFQPEESNDPEASWEPVVGTKLQRVKTQQYRYWLEVDSKDNIIGGRYIDDDNLNLPPDFVWTSTGVSSFKGEFEKLDILYKESQK